MKIVLWGKGGRGVACLERLHKGGYDIALVVRQSGDDKVYWKAEELGLPNVCMDDIGYCESLPVIWDARADVFVLAGYGKILKQDILNIPKLMTINLHAGKLPEYRGSSPMNWALINGEAAFTLSIIKVDTGVDTGDILLDKTFTIGANDTIRELQGIANSNFSMMLIQVLESIEHGSYTLTSQEGKVSYYPLRFPDDGLIVWDRFTAEQVHNKVKALMEPYPAFTYHEGNKVKVLSSHLSQKDYYGEPGRVYRVNGKGTLVCASDKCLWVTLEESVKRYDKFKES